LHTALHGAQEALLEKLRQVTRRQETQGGNAKALEEQSGWPQIGKANIFMTFS
jgi:hypothetical protein